MPLARKCSGPTLELAALPQGVLNENSTVIV